MENKIYVVECSSGEWDGYHTWIGGIFDTNELAEQCVIDINEEVRIIKENAPPDPDEIYEKKEEELTESEFDAWCMSEDNNMYELNDAFYEYLSSTSNINNAMDWNSATIKVFNVNENLGL